MTDRENKDKKALKNRRMAMWGLAVTSVGLALWQLSIQQIFFTTDFHSAGENLLHGVRTPETVLCMPLTSLLISFMRYHTAISAETLAAGLSLLTYILFFAIGATSGGPFKGLLYFLSATILNLTVSAHEMEQVVYAPLLLLYAAIELRRPAKDTLYMAAAGLALSLTLITRSPLFLFPPLFLIWDIFENPAAGATGWKRRAVFLACSYAALLPWLRLTHSLSGGFQLFEGERLNCIMITGAQGAVFAPAASDCRVFAGIAPDANIYAWAAKTILNSPAPYVLSVFRRLWQIFLMFPALFLLAGLALPLRKKEDRFTALLAGYFLLMHSLLAMESRYLYPLRYLLLMLGLSGAWQRLFGDRITSEGNKISGKLVWGIFGLALAFVVLVETLVLIFPGAPKDPEASVNVALKRYPDDVWLLKKRRELLLYSPKGDSARTGILSEVSAVDPNNAIYNSQLSALASNLEKGNMAAAVETFKHLKDLWNAGKNGLTAAPYMEDRELDRRIRATNRTLWDNDIYGAILGYPPGKRAAIVRNLARITSLTPKLQYLAFSERRFDEAGTKELLDILASDGLRPWLNRYDAAGRLLTTALKRAPACTPGGTRERGALILKALELELRANPGGLLKRYRPDRNVLSDEEVLALADAARTLLYGKTVGKGSDGPAELAKDNLLYAWLSLRASGCGVRETKIMKKFLDSDPFPAEAAAFFYTTTNRRKDASRLMAGLVPADADLISALFSAFILQELTEYNRALEFAERAVAIAPADPAVLNQRGILLRLTGNFSRAEEDFHHALETDPEYLSAMINLASLTKAVGRPSEAAIYYSKALKNESLPAAVRIDITRILERLRTSGVKEAQPKVK
ncbi:MAG: hypothetical protein WCK75_11235 [Elusimicrobiota bacterium]